MRSLPGISVQVDKDGFGKRYTILTNSLSWSGNIFLCITVYIIIPFLMHLHFTYFGYLLS